MKLEFITALLSLPAASWAYPYAAGACPGGLAAVGGSHLEAGTFRTGPLDEVAIEFAINGIPLVADDTFLLPIGLNHTWSINVTDDSERNFKGFLVRLEGADVDTSMAFIIDPDDEDVQGAVACVAPVGGVTHTSKDEKSEVFGEFILDDMSMEMTLDVTVVIENEAGKSAYFYSLFSLSAVDGDMGLMGNTATAIPSLSETMIETLAGSTEDEGVGQSIEKSG